MDPVIIAGGGPVGLTLALALARHDVPSIVLDHDAAGPPQRPRSVVLRHDTVALLDRLGCTDLAAEGASWTAWRTLRRRQELRYLVFDPDPSPTRHPVRPVRALPNGTEPGGGQGDRGQSGGQERDGDGVTAVPSPLHLPQEQLVSVLREATTASCLIQVVTDCRVEALEQDRMGVVVHARGGPADWWRASFVVGCDGPRSTVRKQLGVGFPGRTAIDRYATATVRVALPFPNVALLHWNPPWRNDTEVTARPLPDDVWRIDWRLSARSARVAAASRGLVLTPDALVAKVRETLAGWCGSVPRYDLLDSTEYSVHQRLAQRWRVGRAFLAGDAAHVLGALGMQSVDEGLRDADNLAWKLAVAWHGDASETLLDSYQAERRGMVGSRLRAADQALPLVRSSGALRSARRSVLSGSARRHSSLLSDGHVGIGRLGGAPRYDSSPLTAAPTRGRGARETTPYTSTPIGDQVPDVPVTTLDGTRTRLRDCLGRALLVVLVAPGTAVWDSKHWLTAGLMPPLAAATEGLPMRAELVVAESYPGANPHTILLVRPDGHLAAAMPGFDAGRLLACADVVRGGPTSSQPSVADPAVLDPATPDPATPDGAASEFADISLPRKAAGGELPQAPPAPAPHSSTI